VFFIQNYLFCLMNVKELFPLCVNSANIRGLFNKNTDEHLHRRWKSTAFRAGFWLRFMPQNKFCGYENSAFQAKNTLEYRNIHRSGSLQFIGSFCLKGNNLHNRRSRPADKNVPTITAWKAEPLQLHRWISAPAKKNTDRLDDLSIYWWIPDDAGGIIFNFASLRLRGE